MEADLRYVFGEHKKGIYTYINDLIYTYLCKNVSWNSFQFPLSEPVIGTL